MQTETIAPHEGMGIEEVISLGEFKSLDMIQRREYLEAVRRYLPDKTIRQHWGLKYNTWHNYITDLNLREQADKVPDQLRGRPRGVVENTQRKRRMSKPKEKPADKPAILHEGGKDLAPESIAAQDEVGAGEKEAATASETVAAATLGQKAIMLSYELEDEPEALRERLIAIANLVAVEKGLLKVKIEVIN